MAEVGTYRIRWAIVSRGNGHRLTRERMCIAERRNWLCWWPLFDGDWRFDQSDAERDIQRDVDIRKPLPPILHVGLGMGEHEHRWIDITTVSDKGERRKCMICGIEEITWTGRPTHERTQGYRR